ncbi:HAD hydrolase, family IIB [Edhazardia aedis USNM 41457]|uniref:Phosphomannomutase n=1 Tax=Edhazardia aedis (strain USNM 41457) TaxID=1003232 RepID=J8ZVJ8_EDHAE|nr:HAD hydrolase, family IIB [Edhazardia aedis USNM 41457]|eukprot:EJW03673.1 HAD hydrolase, family IIB [Edhazardia aedis USNM 41457]
MKRQTIFLFDVDGTLTPSRQKITPEIKKMLQDLRKEVFIGFVGGSDIAKQKEQMGNDCLKLFDFGFPENGVSFYKGECLVEQKKLIDVLGEEKYKEFVNFCMLYLSKLDIPIKRGNFIEFRSSMINISPIGRNCSQIERKKFKEYDDVKKIREGMVEELRDNFDKYDLHFSIGGEISIDVFPKGWDKRYCIRHIHQEGIKDIVFFGDMTHLGGNDYEIFNDPNVKGVTVKNPEDTIQKVAEKLRELKETGHPSSNM